MIILTKLSDELPDQLENQSWSDFMQADITFQGINPAEITYRACDHWGLPEDICDTLNNFCHFKEGILIEEKDSLEHFKPLNLLSLSSQVSSLIIGSPELTENEESFGTEVNDLVQQANDCNLFITPMWITKNLSDIMNRSQVMLANLRF